MTMLSDLEKRVRWLEAKVRELERKVAALEDQAGANTQAAALLRSSASN